ncbi:MAG: helix-turn-helix domain-containing protein [Chloroflexota bacterium]|nr:helix-turn-helix domain-containing protein [Chloroflexota bacterium]
MVTKKPPYVNRSHNEPRIVTNVEAARQLGCSARSVQRWRRKGLLVTVVVNGRARVLSASIRDLVAKGTH